MLLLLCLAMMMLSLLTRSVSVRSDRREFSGFHHMLKQGKAHLDYTHSIVLAVKQPNADELTKLFEDITDPKSERHRKYLRRKEIQELTGHLPHAQVVEEYLRQYGISAIRSEYGEYFTIHGTVKMLNEFLSTEFHEYEITGRDNTKVPRIVVRAEDYVIPAALEDHIYTIFNVNDVPSPVAFKSDFQPIVDEDDAVNTIDENGSDISQGPVSLADPVQSITPPFLTNLYGIYPQANMSSLGSQCVYATIDQNFSPANLKTFQQTYGLPLNPISRVIGGHNSDLVCLQTPNSCVEANLDVQYMLAVSSNISTMYSYDADVDNFLTTWMVSVSSMSDPPLVISISYGILEAYLSNSFVNNFNLEAIKVGLQGVTILAASGDDGAAGYNVVGNKKNCGYYPMWPASSPYVLSVGATQGPEVNAAESACMARTGGRITTGGGFSRLSGQPSWQKEAVDTYFSTVKPLPFTGAATSAKYARSGRGYPDISLVGFNYRVLIGKTWYAVSGTSASAPVFAGMLALINAKRLAQGWPSVGFFNSELYANASHFIRDVTNGDNLCVSAGSSGAPICCSHGFYTAPGWDPVTGFGSVDFTSMYSFFTSPHLETDVTQSNGATTMHASNSLVVVLMLIVSLTVRFWDRL